eukprot:CAMPEP_0174364662 /NCGR_PEP_ID=MMETSP0811_2-20130205/73856_1 /TAXON_ID=73025 ORGANISM="Eutreptiella gymnastica-like, Strain CCMP1594" /NCGR_SAMPLE_ID=MMETSP0811_2 /ASSEMBLY_ACC=CAM_ASM_000667 /LENGTH=113 /DNA_ID=CAMNT_0015504533 /DNA_START=267 /DNA_END=608 /DNA_ORIENTATION=+
MLLHQWLDHPPQGFLKVLCECRIVLHDDRKRHVRRQDPVPALCMTHHGPHNADVIGVEVAKLNGLRRLLLRGGQDALPGKGRDRQTGEVQLTGHDGIYEPEVVLQGGHLFELF